MSKLETLDVLHLKSLRAALTATNVPSRLGEVRDNGTLSVVVAAADEHRASLAVFEKPWVDCIGWANYGTDERQMTVYGRPVRAQA